MGRYSIKDLEKLSNIKAHTIRIWEKRYNLISPQRTDTNIRYYGDDQVKKLLNVSILNTNGIKISHIADFSDKEITHKVNEILAKPIDADTQVQFLLGAMMKLDEFSFVNELDKFISSNGFYDTMVNIVYPLLDRIGVLWLSDNITPAHEHFISNLVRQKLIAEINTLPTPTSKSKKWILFLPENESHELGLLFAYYILKLKGNHVFYLGQNVPLDSFKGVLQEIECDNVFSIWTSPHLPEDFNAYLNSTENKNITFYYSSTKEQTKSNPECKFVSSPKNFFDLIS